MNRGPAEADVSPFVEKGILSAATPCGWAEHAVQHFDRLLIDHAHCEKKAAASALALIAQHPEHTWLVGPLAALAQEELRHFSAVYKLIVAKGLTLTRDPGDPYVKALLTQARHGPEERLGDRLLLLSLVEARSAERLALIAEHLAGHESESTVAFYRRLAHAEAGHHRLFVRLATKCLGAKAVQKRRSELMQFEAQIMFMQPLAPRMH